LKEDFPELDILAPEKIGEIPNLDYDLIIVDTPPYLSNRLNELFGYSDYVLVPTKAGFFDVMAIKSTLALIKFAQAQNQNLKAGIVLNMLKPRSGITAEVVELIQTLGTPLLKTRVFDRVSLARSSMTSGILKSMDQKAIEEVTFLAEEIVDLISV
jgi:chromosome partitioning protein